MNGIDDVVKKAQVRTSMPSPGARRLIRRQARLTQEDLASALGITRAAVSRWESGQREPSGSAGEAYARLLERLRREVLV